MAFAFTILADWTFSQVLTYTAINRLKDNQQDLHDSLDTEHIFTSGVHRRITKSPNLLINPTGRRGNAFWWDAGAGSGANDPGYANPANFSDLNHWTPDGGEGPMWSYAGASGGFLGDLSERIPIGGTKNLVLSGEVNVSGFVTGDAAIAVVCYDAGGNHLSQVAQSTIIAGTTGFEKREATGTTHANTAYIRIRKHMTNTWDATNLLIKSLKVEKGTIATTYSDESSMPQYLSARYTSNAGQTINSGATTIVNFEDKGFDDPGLDRVTIGAAWKFTADRYMKVRVSAKIEFESDANWALGDAIGLTLYLNNAAYANIDYKMMQVNAAFAFINGVSGCTIIELDKDDFIDVRVTQQSGVALDLDNNTLNNFIDIEEI